MQYYKEKNITFYIAKSPNLLYLLMINVLYRYYDTQMHSQLLDILQQPPDIFLNHRVFRLLGNLYLRIFHIRYHF